MKRLDRFSSIGVSVVGGLAHNLGQIIAACMVMKTSAIAYYLIPLTISGTIAGGADNFLHPAYFALDDITIVKE